jgi:hypothetical protein
MRPPLEQKSMNKRKWPVPDALPLAQYYITTVLTRLHLAALMVRFPKGREAEGVEKEAKV